MGILVIVIVVVGAVVVASKKRATDVAVVTDSTQNSMAADASASSGTNAGNGNSDTAKDGTYTAVGTYVSPGGTQHITVKVSLKGGVVTDATATSGAIDNESKLYQQDFISGYKSQVVGKSIDHVKLSRVSGSSLTSQGFNDAISQIRKKAEA